MFLSCIVWIQNYYSYFTEVKDIYVTGIGTNKYNWYKYKYNSLTQGKEKIFVVIMSQKKPKVTKCQIPTSAVN